MKILLRNGMLLHIEEAGDFSVQGKVFRALTKRGRVLASVVEADMAAWWWDNEAVTVEAKGEKG
jgi:hypothetical protein